MENVGPILVCFLIFGGGGMLTKMWSDYNNTRIELAKLKAQQQSAPVGSNREIETLRTELETTRQELRDLRDTSMQYDISFDTAIGRVESRVAHVERRIGINVSEAAEETITVTGR